jgi:WD40 repeat protein
LVRLSADGSTVVRASVQSDVVTVWNAIDGSVRTTRRGYRPGLAAVAVSADGSRILSASTGDAAPRLWDAFTGETLAVLSGHARPVTAVAVAAEGARVISAADDGTLRIWETRLGSARDLWRGRRDGD